MAFVSFQYGLELESCRVPIDACIGPSRSVVFCVRDIAHAQEKTALQCNVKELNVLEEATRAATTKLSEEAKERESACNCSLEEIRGHLVHVDVVRPTTSVC